MKRLALVLVACMLSACASMQGESAKLVGSWKLVSFQVEFQDNGEKQEAFGKAPKGVIIFTSTGRVSSYLEAETRKAPQTDEERAAAYRSMLAYFGRYRVEGDRFVTSVDGSWNVIWNGTDQSRDYKLVGDRLEIVSQWGPAPARGNRMARGVLVWEREK